MGVRVTGKVSFTETFNKHTVAFNKVSISTHQENWSNPNQTSWRFNLAIWICCQCLPAYSCSTDKFWHLTSFDRSQNYRSFRRSSSASIVSDHYVCVCVVLVQIYILSNHNIGGVHVKTDNMTIWPLSNFDSMWLNKGRSQICSSSPNT